MSKILSVVAYMLAGAALAVSLAHAGPRGPQGPQGARGLQGQQGQQGRAADATHQRYGICWNSSLFTQTWSDGTSSTWVSSVSIDQPQYTGGVYTCPMGDTFVSIVPQAASHA